MDQGRNGIEHNLHLFPLTRAMIFSRSCQAMTEIIVTSIGNDAAYYSMRAQEELEKARRAKARGDVPKTVAAYSELAVRYQAKAALAGGSRTDTFPR